MAIGPGIYDDECTKIREELKASAVMLIVFDGQNGDGFSVQAPIELTMNLPNLLESMAHQIRNDLATSNLFG